MSQGTSSCPCPHCGEPIEFGVDYMGAPEVTHGDTDRCERCGKLFTMYLKLELEKIPDEEQEPEDPE